MRNKIMIRMKLQRSNGLTKIRALIYHPMESGRRISRRTGRIIPADYIEEVKFEHNGEVIARVLLGPDSSPRPTFYFNVIGLSKGNTVKVMSLDNNGGVLTKSSKVR